MRFFEPKKIFCKNLLRPSFTYDDTLLSCKKSEKNDLIFRFLDVLSPKFAQNFFFRHIRGFIVMHLCAKNQKIWMSQSQEKLITSNK